LGQRMLNSPFPLPVAGECHQVALGGSRMMRGNQDVAHYSVIDKARKKLE